MEHTEEDLRQLILSFKEGLQLYSTTLSQSLSDIKSSSHLVAPDEELTKLAKLLSAHATKVGIAFRPPVSVNASYEQLKETSAKMLLIVGVVAQFDEQRWSSLFYKEVINRVRELIQGYVTLLDELDALDFKDDSKEHSEGRLISVGKIWDSCKSIEALMSVGNFGLLREQIKLSMGIVEDASAELNEWIEDPFIEAEINFGKVDEEDEEEEEQEEEQQVSSYTIEFANKWTGKIKMLKLLLSSLGKSLPSSVETGTSIDEFNKEQNTLGALVDDLVCDIFLNSESKDLDANALKVKDQSQLLIKLVRQLNKDDDKKTKWLDLWSDKFLQ